VSRGPYEKSARAGRDPRAKQKVAAFVTDADVKNLHARLTDEWTAVATAIRDNASKLTQDQLATYSTLATRVSTYQADTPSLLRAASQMNTGEALERDVFTFVDSIRASGVPGLPATPNEAPKTTLDKIVDFVPMALLAFVVFEVVSNLPRKR
jgi:hypothetical protein